MKIKRILSAFLAGAVVLGSMAIPAFAEETGMTEETCVAQIGDKKYETLQAALSKAENGNTITLLKDIDITNGDKNYGTYLNKDIAITLD